MSRTIYKAVLDPGLPSPQSKQLPFGARPLHVGRDTREEGKVAVWFECDPDAQLCGVPLWLVGTGREIPGALVHVGSAVTGDYAWHVYMGRR